MHNGSSRSRPATFAPRSNSNSNTMSSAVVNLEPEPVVVAAFFSALQNNDLERVVDYITNSVSSILESRNETGETALIVACRLGYLTMARLLVRNGSDVGARDYEYWSSLLNAARNGFVEIVQLLLDSGADVEEADIGGFTPLEWACYKNRLPVVQHLLSRNANVNIVDEHGMTPLTWAAARGFDEVVQELINAQARVNARDRFGNSPLLWACRKSFVNVALALIRAGASVDVVGVQGSTPLILASKECNAEIVEAILKKGCNVNAVDQNGVSALAHSAHEGCLQIVDALLDAGAYVNVADKKKDTILMKAVKSGQVDVVKSLLHKYADMDAQDEEGRTVLHLAIDKGYADSLALLLECRPNTEIRTKDGDTALLRAVRTRNIFMVQMLMQSGSKVSAVDRRGDTSLHIALRCRSKRLTQLLLTRPQDSRLLYQTNKIGETPYSIDQSHSQLILPHIFGPAESQVQTEAMLGYDIYSSVMADIMCEPNLSLPLTVGLYAKWGSGKSFLLNKLKESLGLFSHSWMEMKTLKWSWTLVLIAILISAFVSAIVYGVSSVGVNWLIALCVGLCMSLIMIYFYAFIVYGKWSYCRLARTYLARPYALFQLAAQILFYHPPTLTERDLVSRPVGFLFADYHRLSSIGGAQALANIIETLYVELERHYGTMPVRLCQTFQPSYSGQRQPIMKRWCGIPVAVICVILTFLGLVGLYFCMIYSSTHLPYNAQSHDSPETNINLSTTEARTQPFLVTGAILLFIVVVLAAYPLAMTVANMTFLRPKSQIRRAVAALNRLQFEGLMQKLKKEVSKITEIVHRLDSFSRSQTRMVVFVDGLDSCEQDKMLQTLDAIQILFGSKQNSPFIILIAVDPHIVVTAIQQAMHTAFTATDISGHDYLKNLIQMPFYLQNTAIRKLHDKLRERSESGADGRFQFMRQDTAFGSKLSIAESYRSSTRMRRAFSQNLHAHDAFSQRFVRDDYFSNMNPRSMRRIVNTLALTGRLMRAFEIDFNWVALGHWVSLVEQWPYRLSWIIDYCERQQPSENVSLHEIYEVFKHKVPMAKSEDPLIEIDRNHRNLEVYLENNRDPVLTVGHLRQFVPFTSNLDPYVRKLIHERYDSAFAAMVAAPQDLVDQITQVPLGDPVQIVNIQQPSVIEMASTTGYEAPNVIPVVLGSTSQSFHRSATPSRERIPMGLEQFFKDSIWQVRLSCLTVDEVCSLVRRLPISNSSTVDALCQRFREINASGLVLSFCDLDTLKTELRACFGDWELIVLMIRTLRTRERDYGQMDDIQSRAQSMEPSSMASASTSATVPVRKYSSGLGGSGGGPSGVAGMAKRRATSVRTGRKKTMSGSGAGLVDYNSSSDHVAEVVATQDWLNSRLGHLDSTEFIGDRDLVDSTPRTSRRSSIIREESMGMQSDPNSSYEDVASPTSAPGQLIRDLSPSSIGARVQIGSTSSIPANTATGMPIVGATDEKSAGLAHRLKGLVQSIGGGAANDETGRLLVTQASDTDDEDEKAQLTVMRKPDDRPSVFQMVQTTRAASVPNVNTIAAETLMEMDEIMAAAPSSEQTGEKSTHGSETEPDSRF